MAKIPFSKLGVKLNSEVCTIVFNEQFIEIKEYLPIEQKLIMISNVINNCAEDKKYYNVGKIDLYLTLEVLYNYTNIAFTDKQKEDLGKLYDLVVGSGLWDKILDVIGNNYSVLRDWVTESMECIYRYDNSLLGFMDNIVNDYDLTKLDATTIQQSLADPKNLELLKDILTKLG